MAEGLWLATLASGGFAGYTQGCPGVLGTLVGD